MINHGVRSAVAKFHNDEAGLEAMQVVMILAVAAVALIVVKTQWNLVKSWFDKNSSEAITGWEGGK